MSLFYGSCYLYVSQVNFSSCVMFGSPVVVLIPSPVLVSHKWNVPSSVADTASCCLGDMWHDVTRESWLTVHCVCV